MKARTFILLIPLCFALASSAQYEDLIVSGNYSEEKLSDVLQDLHRQYELRFSYDSHLLDGMVVSISFQDQLLYQALNNLLQVHNLSYRVIGKSIVIFPMPPQSMESSVPEKKRNFNWKGVVKDATSGEALPFAVVRIRGLSAGTQTNENGYFVFENLPSDTCVAIVNYIGYDEVKIRVQPMEKGRQEILMLSRRNVLPLAVFEEKGLSVINPETASGLVTINPTEISTISANGEPDILRAAQLIAGISGTTENSSGLIVRGSDPDQTLVSFDDFTIYHLDHFFGAFSALNASAIKSMRIHKGGMEARYGGRIAGVVEIVGKEGNRYKPGAQLNIGALSTSLFIETPMGHTERATLVVAARRSFTDLIYSPTYKKQFNSTYAAAIITNPGEVANEFSQNKSPDYYFQDFTAKITIRPSSEDVITLSGYAGNDQLKIGYGNTLLDGRYNVSYNDNNQWGNKGGGFRWSHDWSSQWKSLVTAGYSQYSSELFAVDTIADQLFQLSTISFRNTSQNLHDFTARSEMNKQNQNSSSTFGVQVNSMVIYSNERFTETIQDFTQKGTVLVAYFQRRIQRNNLEITPGFRVNYYSPTNKIYPEWRLNGVLKRGEYLNLKGSIGRVYQFIHRIRNQSLYLNNPDEWQLSSPNAVPVLRSDQFTIGAQYRRAKWVLDIEGYYKRNQNSVEYLGPYIGKVSENVLNGSIISGYGNIWGADFFTQLDLRKHRLWVAYTLQKATNFFNQLDHKRVPELFDQRHEIKTGYEWRSNHWEYGLAWFLGTGRPYTPYLGSYTIALLDGSQQRIPVFGDLNSARLPTYHRLDASVGYLFTWKEAKAKLSFSFFNIYNRTNIRDIQYLVLSSSNVTESIAQRNIRMQGFVPSFQFQVQF